jgi:hypothetical protein
MASPGTVDTKQLHDPKEEKVVTNHSEREKFLLDQMNVKGARRILSTWETDGGNVPAEEEVYLVNGQLKKGMWAAFQSKLQQFFPKKSES